jgi:hypothetical protein
MALPSRSPARLLTSRSGGVGSASVSSRFANARTLKIRPLPSDSAGKSSSAYEAPPNTAPGHGLFPSHAGAAPAFGRGRRRAAARPRAPPEGWAPQTKKPRDLLSGPSWLRGGAMRAGQRDIVGVRAEARGVRTSPCAFTILIGRWVRMPARECSTSCCDCAIASGVRV